MRFQYSKAGLVFILLGTLFEGYSLYAQYVLGRRDFFKYFDIEIAGLALILFGLLIIVFEYYGYQSNDSDTRTKYNHKTV